MEILKPGFTSPIAGLLHINTFPASASWPINSLTVSYYILIFV